MKITQQFAHGGDAQFYKIDRLPAGAKKVASIEERIIARGETSGHAHIVTGDVQYFTAEIDGETRTFLAVGYDGAFHQHYKEANIKEETFSINRNISDCDHTKDCRLEPGIYAVGIDRQYDPHEGVWNRNLD